MRTETSRQLVDAYRMGQAQISRQTILLTLAAWRGLLTSGSDRDRATAAWLAIMIRAMRTQGAASGVLAQRFAEAYRVAEVGLSATPFDIPAYPDLIEEQIITSMMVTGPQALRKLEERIDGPASGQIARKIMESNARAAQRHVVNVGRSVLEDIAQNDPLSKGWVRVTDGDPCHFCAMLASRGPVYDGDSFDESDPRFDGPGQHKVHDGCGCMLVAIYGPAPILAQTRMYEKRWIEAGELAKQEKISTTLAFRRLHEAAR